MTKNEDSERVAFLKKKNEARKKASMLDWEKDGVYSAGGRIGYRYLTVAKMKRNLLPIFMECGLDFKFDYQNLQKFEAIGNMSQHWVLECTATLTDVDTGYSETSVVYGEAGDSGDKALGKASTYALKLWLSNTFMLIDGIDSEGSDGEGMSRTFIPKSDREQEEVRSKVFANGIKPDDAKPEKVLTPVTPKATTKGVTPKKKEVKPPSEDEVPKTEEKPAEPVKEEPVKEEPAKEMTEAEKALDKLKEQAKAEFKLSVPQQKIIDRIVAQWSEKGKNGEITNEQAAEFAKERSEIFDNKSAIAFIKKYREA